MAKTEISESELLVNVLVAGLEEKKGEDIVSLDLRNLKNTFAEFMVICSGSNYKQLEALVDSAEDFARKQLSEKPFVREASARMRRAIVGADFGAASITTILAG